MGWLLQLIAAEIKRAGCCSLSRGERERSSGARPGRSTSVIEEKRKARRPEPDRRVGRPDHDARRVGSVLPAPRGQARGGGDGRAIGLAVASVNSSAVPQGKNAVTSVRVRPGNSSWPPASTSATTLPRARGKDFRDEAEAAGVIAHRFRAHPVVGRGGQAQAGEHQPDDEKHSVPWPLRPSTECPRQRRSARTMAIRGAERERRRRQLVRGIPSNLPA
jgi:hypothetical protein